MIPYQVGMANMVCVRLLRPVLMFSACVQASVSVKLSSPGLSRRVRTQAFCLLLIFLLAHLGTLSLPFFALSRQRYAMSQQVTSKAKLLSPSLKGVRGWWRVKVRVHLICLVLTSPASRSRVSSFSFSRNVNAVTERGVHV